MFPLARIGSPVLLPSRFTGWKETWLARFDCDWQRLVQWTSSFFGNGLSLLNILFGLCPRWLHQYMWSIHQISLNTTFHPVWNKASWDCHVQSVTSPQNVTLQSSGMFAHCALALLPMWSDHVSVPEQQLVLVHTISWKYTFSTSTLRQAISNFFFPERPNPCRPWEV